MKIGGYRDNTNSSQTIDLSPEVQDTTPAADVVPEPINTPPVDLPIEGAAVSPDVQDTSIEIQETGQFDDPVVDTPAPEVIPAEEVTVTPDVPLVEEVVVDEPVEISEEATLKYLSEKLGREVTSFDDLKTTNPLDSDPYLKGLSEWREKTGRPIEDWIKFQKDYTQVSDVDIAREFLQIEYPELSPEQVDLELNHKFVSSEDDLDNEAAIKNLELTKYASKGRKELSKLVSDLGDASPVNYSQEVTNDLAIAKQYKANVEAQKAGAQQYEANITAKASELKSINLDLAEGVSLDFKLPEGSNKSLVETIQNAPDWKNADGSWNHQNIVRDTAIIANFKTMLSLAFEQGKNSGTDAVIQEAKNTTLGQRTTADSVAPSANKGAQIEGLDNYLGKRGMTIKRGRRN